MISLHSSIFENFLGSYFCLAWFLSQGHFVNLKTLYVLFCVPRKDFFLISVTKNSCWLKILIQVKCEYLQNILYRQAEADLREAQASQSKLNLLSPGIFRSYSFLRLSLLASFRHYLYIYGCLCSWGRLHFEVIFKVMGIFMISSSFLRLSLFLMSSSFLRMSSFWSHLCFKVVFISISNLVYSPHMNYPSSLILWGIKATRKLWTSLSWLMYGLCTLRAEWGIGNCIAKMRNWRFNYCIQMLMHF